MKKLLAIIIAAVMIAACTVTAFADTTDVSYNVDPSYTVSIPASVTLGDADVTADITASDVLLENGKQINVELTSASNTASGSTFNAKNGDSTVTYTITGDSAIAVGDTVATFTEDGNKTLTFSAADKSAVTVAGKHTETLTFTISTSSSVPYADAATLCNHDENGYAVSSFYDGRNLNATIYPTITKDSAMAIADYLGGGDIMVVYDMYADWDGNTFFEAVDANGTTLKITYTSSAHVDAPLYYVSKTNGNSGSTIPLP